MEPTIKSKVDSLYENTKLLINQQKEILILDVADKSSKLLSGTISDVIIAALSAIILLFLSIAAAWLIGESLHSMPMGFFIISLVYVFVLGLVLAFSKTIIQNTLINYFIKRILHAFHN